MNTPRLARCLLGFLAVEFGICAAFIADEWTPLRSFEDTVFKSFFRVAQGPDYVIDQAPDDSRMKIVRALTPGLPLSYLRIEVDHESSDLTPDGSINPSHVFETYPLSPEDWAVIIANARKAGNEMVDMIAIDQPLTWNKKDDLYSLSILDSQIQTYDRAVLVVDVRRDHRGGTRPPPIPKYLSRHAIPLSQVQRYDGQFKQVDQVVFPPSALGNENTIFAFRLNETAPSAPDEDRLFTFPAFVRWDQHLIPSFPVAVAMARYQASPHEVEIVLGEHIRIGKGPLLPIDSDGRLRLALGQPKDVSSMLAAEELAGVSYLQNLHLDTPTMALFTNATKGIHSPWRSPSHLQKVLNTIDTRPQPGPPQRRPRLPAWGELLTFSIIALIAAILLRFNAPGRLLSFTLLLLASAVLLALLLKTTQTQIPLTPILATGLAGLILTFLLQKYAPAHLPQPPARSFSPPAESTEQTQSST